MLHHNLLTVPQTFHFLVPTLVMTEWNTSYFGLLFSHIFQIAPYVPGFVTEE